MIRVRYLRALSDTLTEVFRVRVRPGWLDERSRKWTYDTDGDDTKPLTWSRWEENYFLQGRQADREMQGSWRTPRRPLGVIDRVPAKMLWRRLERDYPALIAHDYDRGRYALIPALTGAPGLMECDPVLATCESQDAQSNPTATE
jgi:hypothetical protein